MIRVTTEWNSTEGAPYYTTHHFGVMIAGAQDAVNAVAALWGDVVGWFNPLVTPTVGGEVHEVDPVTGATTATVVIAPQTVTMTGSGAPVPWASQVLWRWRTGVYVAGREIRGRTFVPGFGSNNLTSGNISSTLVTQMSGVLNTWLANEGSTFVVWSPTKGQSAVVNSGSVWNELAVLRSRRD